jgi:hypothetical protein
VRHSEFDGIDEAKWLISDAILHDIAIIGSSAA